MKTLVTVLAITSALALTAPAHASIIEYTVHLNGTTDQFPVNASTATGTAVVTLNDVTNTLNLVLSFSGLIGGPASAAHIHCCTDPGANAPVVVPFPNFPAATSGTYTQSFSISSTITAGIEAGQSYINIHNAVFPGGEIRANLTPATISNPEPGTLVLFGGALAALVGLRRKSRRG